MLAKWKLAGVFGVLFVFLYSAPAAAKNAYKFIECEARIKGDTGYVLSGILTVDGHPNSVLIYDFQNYIKREHRRVRQVSSCKVSRFTEKQDARRNYAKRVVERRAEGSNIIETNYTLPHPELPVVAPAKETSFPAFGVLFGRDLDPAMIEGISPVMERFLLEEGGRTRPVIVYSGVLVPKPTARFSRYSVTLGRYSRKVVGVQAQGLVEARRYDHQSMARYFDSLKSALPVMEDVECQEHYIRGFHEYDYGERGHGVLKAYGDPAGASIHLSTRAAGFFHVIEQEHISSAREARRHLN